MMQCLPVGPAISPNSPVLLGIAAVLRGVLAGQLAALCMRYALNILHAVAATAMMMYTNGTIALLCNSDMAQKYIQRPEFMACFF